MPKNEIGPIIAENKEIIMNFLIEMIDAKSKQALYLISAFDDYVEYDGEFLSAVNEKIKKFNE